MDELLDLIELDPSKFYNRYPPELSGGQKQRIGIARALAANPTFIVCDEVTSALDQLVAEASCGFLDRLQNELNLAYMFITHDLATVRSIADEVIVMQQAGWSNRGQRTICSRRRTTPIPTCCSARFRRWIQLVDHAARRARHRQPRGCRGCADRPQRSQGPVSA